MKALIACTLLLAAGAAGADTAPRFTLRFATPAPDGTAWAREVRAFARDVESTTHGDVRLKIVWGGIAGDDVQVAERIERSQLDGVVSGGMLCEQRAPTHKALRLVGVYNDYEEANWVAGQLRDAIEREARDHGYTYLADVNLGVTEVFSRKPLRTLAELKAARLWVWDIDTTQSSVLKEMGFDLVLLPLDQAGAAFADGRHDGFFAIPAAMLAYQWAPRTRFVTDVRVSYLIGCIMLANRAFDRLPGEHQLAVRLAAARARARVNTIVMHDDAQLMGGAFGKTGMTTVTASSELRAQFEAAALAARRRLGEKVLPAALSKRVAALVSDYRQSHQRHAGATP